MTTFLVTTPPKPGKSLRTVVLKTNDEKKAIRKARALKAGGEASVRVFQIKDFVKTEVAY